MRLSTDVRRRVRVLLVLLTALLVTGVAVEAATIGGGVPIRLFRRL